MSISESVYGLREYITYLFLLFFFFFDGGHYLKVAAVPPELFRNVFTEVSCLLLAGARSEELPLDYVAETVKTSFMTWWKRHCCCEIVGYGGWRFLSRCYVEVKVGC